MQTRIVIVAKAPVPGKVKTRLIPALGEEGAARLAGRMLRDTVEEASKVDVAEVELCADPEPSHPEWQDLLPSALLTAQGSGDLGRRLARAAERVLAEGQRVILVGTDCPSLDERRLRQACWELEGHDAVIHPTFDGGYALLGLARFDPSIFSDIEWSTPSVARATMARIAALGWSLHIAETLQDIDEPEDLSALPFPAAAG
jgi:rSAM/selenodomain-associated transferase 1